MKTETSKLNDSTSISSNLGILGSIAIIAPCGISWRSGYITIWASVWSYSTNAALGISYWDIIPIAGLFGFPFYLPLRIIFLVFVKRYYDSKCSLRKMLLIGILIECVIVFYSLVDVLAFVFNPSYAYLSIAVPTPFLVLGAWMLTRGYTPEKDEGAWIEKESMKGWGPTITREDSV